MDNKLNNQKREIKNQLEKTLELVKNLKEPKNQEEQKLLNGILKKVENLDSYILITLKNNNNE